MEDLYAYLIGPFDSMSHAVAHLEIARFRGNKSAAMGIYRDGSPAYKEALTFAVLKLTPERDLELTK